MHYIEDFCGRRLPVYVYRGHAIVRHDKKRWFVSGPDGKMMVAYQTKHSCKLFIDVILDGRKVTDYDRMVAESSDRGERNDCGVISLALACGVSYDGAHQALADAGRKNGRGSKVGAVVIAARALGFSAHLIKPRKRMTVAKVGTHYPRGRYIVLTRSHAAAMVDGGVLDWMNGRRFIVEEVVELRRV